MFFFKFIILILYIFFYRYIYTYLYIYIYIYPSHLYIIILLWDVMSMVFAVFSEPKEAQINLTFFKYIAHIQQVIILSYKTFVLKKRFVLPCTKCPPSPFPHASPFLFLEKLVSLLNFVSKKDSEWGRKKN